VSRAGILVVVLALWVGGDAVNRESRLAPAARDYLDHALTVLEDNALDRARVDWPAVRADAFAAAREAQGPEDTHGAIRGAIAAIGNPHTALIPPADTAAPPADGIPVPTGESLDGRFAKLTLPALHGDSAGTERYVTAGREAVRTLDAAGPCGWLVDLTTNDGGHMWPLLTVLAPLLGNGRVGSFVDHDSDTVFWEIRDGEVLLNGKVMGRNRQQLNRPSPPVAVLTSQFTASSGEGAVVSFLSLARARTFGLPTAGFATANQAYPLADGALLLVTTAFMADRTGRRYGGPIAPAVTASPRTGEHLDAAKAWLATRSPCAP
jgi:hypothetical protein